MNSDCLVIGVAGGTGSGKTTIVKKIKEHFGDDVSVVCHDWYYRAQHGLTLEERSKQNYDCPEAFETDLLIYDLGVLRSGTAINCPQYDYTTHNRSNDLVRVEPKRVIVVEGILLFTDNALTDMFDIKIFVDTDADVRILRRISRDVKERGRSMDSVIEQYINTVKPMHEKYVEPSKKKADIIVPVGGKNPVALDMIFGSISRFLAK